MVVPCAFTVSQEFWVGCKRKYQYFWVPVSSTRVEIEKQGQGEPCTLFCTWCRALWGRVSCWPAAAWRSYSLFPVLMLQKNVADHSLCCSEPRLSASLSSTNLAAEQVSKSSNHLALQSWFSPTTECERQTSTLPWHFLPCTPEWRPEKRIDQWMLCTLPHHIGPEVGLCCSFSPTSHPVVERVTMFWLSLSGKRIPGPVLSPLLSGLMSPPCSMNKRTPPDLLLSTHKWEVWPLLKHAGHGSCEVPPTSAFWLWWLGIFNLIYLFPLFKTKQFLAHWKKKKKSQMFCAFLRQRCTPGCILGLNMEIPESELLCLEYL